MSRDLAAEIRTALADAELQLALPKATGLSARHRREAVDAYPSYEAARDRARAIKERAIERMPELVEQLEESVRSAGGHVYRAADAEQACSIITGIATERGLARAVKSKSMTSEEIHLNAALEGAGIAVRETDLGEYIVQIDGDRPSHIIAPIIHKGLEDVREAFRTGLGMDEVPQRAEELTQLARELLRSDFLAADLGITGANFLIAASGTVVIVENEGNARMCTQLPAVHVALAGVEKILPTMADLEPFLELLPRSATGQLQTAYLSVISGPGWDESPLVQRHREFHLVLLDNGRTEMRDDPVLREALYCVRCGACLNVCAPYQAVGGHVYGGPTYQSGIGNAWEAGVSSLDTAAEFNELCTGCSRCRDVCPVRIDIPWMNMSIRERIGERDGGRDGVATRLLAEPRRLYELARRGAPLHWATTTPPVRWALERVLGVDRRRALPQLSHQTLAQWHAERGGRVLTDGAVLSSLVSDTVVFWADCHTDHVEVEIGQAAIGVLEALGFEVVLATRSCCGRAAISQGNLGEARRQARETLRLLEPVAEQGLSIVGIEPSCVSCVVEDHRKLVPDDGGLLLLEVAVREIMQFLEDHAERLDRALKANSAAEPTHRHLVVHGHCQQKTAGWFPSTEEVLARLPGVAVTSTSAECCGMAGSFGYKPQGYDISRELGRRLVTEMADLANSAGNGATEQLACGTSCRAQIADFGDAKPRHPVQIVAEAIGL